jgi:uncharacterized protein DUF6526
MAQRVQSYKNHTRFLPPFHFFVIPVLTLNLFNAVRHAGRSWAWGDVWAAVVALALLLLALLSRVQAITVQDRVIRLEMRQRLHELLPPDLRARINELTPRQLVALRFASDAELPVLTRDVLEGRLASQKAIKKAVKTWEADWLRV